MTAHTPHPAARISQASTSSLASHNRCCLIMQVMAFLGWVAGTIFFIVGGCAALYCNLKLASLCIIDGKRYTRFRDISYTVYGEATYGALS